ncbi:MAG: pyruvate ferredoxin oxidoreductase [Phycisphaerae bacterium]|nr:MAG: pyruvate ferredoxin oxidoreductase [Phycisphaerae bacterium]
MPTATTELTRSETTTAGPIINDIVIKVATENGSGSQSSNLILLRAIFNMGIPVSGKNLFPSNIQGLPTWYTIRVNEDGWLAQRNRVDMMVAMNAATVVDDLAELAPGSTIILNENLSHFVTRDDLNVHLVPFNTLVKDIVKDAKLGKLVVNILYVGVVAWVLGIDMEALEQGVDWQFAGKAKAAELNKKALQHGYEWARANLPAKEHFALRPSTAANGQILIEGNESAALGLLFGGVTFAAWYPITPSSSLCEYLADHMKKHRHDPETGKASYAIVQAEDELASIGMVVGAGWTGARSFTSTSGPGISLMAEMVGLAYFAEVPLVVVDVQRMGPSTGLPTRTSQGDIAKAYQLSHGDCKHVLLIPGSVKECFEFAYESLNVAEEFQTPVFLMTDLDLGMNKALSEPFEYPEEPIRRGKVLTAEDLDRVGEFARYRDVDGDGVCYRTLPGTNHDKAAYFTRGTGHTETAGYSEKADNWERNMDRLTRKFDTIRDSVPQPITELSDNASAGVMAYGSSDAAVQEARHHLAKSHEMDLSYCRIRALPVNGHVRSFIEQHETVYVVEQNRDGQMTAILCAEYPELAARLVSVVHYDGIAIDAETIINGIIASADRG